MVESKAEFTQLDQKGEPVILRLWYPNTVGVTQWEDRMETASERKEAKYAELAAACSQAGWKGFIFPVEIGWD